MQCYYGTVPKTITCVVYQKYSTNLSKTKTIVFTVPSAIERATFHMPSTNIGRTSLFGYVIYSTADTHCWQRASAEE